MKTNSNPISNHCLTLSDIPPLTAGTTISYSYDSTPPLIINDNDNFMENNTPHPQQVNLVIFEVERNEDQDIVSTKFINQIWVEHKPKSNLMLTVAKKLAKDVDLDKIVIREIYRCYF